LVGEEIEFAKDGKIFALKVAFMYLPLFVGCGCACIMSFVFYGCPYLGCSFIARADYVACVLY